MKTFLKLVFVLSLFSFALPFTAAAESGAEMVQKCDREFDQAKAHVVRKYHLHSRDGGIEMNEVQAKEFLKGLSSDCKALMASEIKDGLFLTDSRIDSKAKVGDVADTEKVSRDVTTLMSLARTLAMTQSPANFTPGYIFSGVPSPATNISQAKDLKSEASQAPLYTPTNASLAR